MKKGDKVRITDSGRIYTSYYDMFHKMGFNDAIMPKDQTENQINDKYIIFAKAFDPHQKINIYGIENKAGRQFLFAENGLKKIKSKKSELQRRYNNVCSDLEIITDNFFELAEEKNELKTRFIKSEKRVFLLFRDYETLVDDYNKILSNFNDLSKENKELKTKLEITKNIDKVITTGNKTAEQISPLNYGFNGITIGFPAIKEGLFLDPKITIVTTDSKGEKPLKAKNFKEFINEYPFLGNVIETFGISHVINEFIES